MADRLSNGFGFGQGFGANGLDGQQIARIPNVDQTPQWAQFGGNHAMNPNINPQMAQLLGQRNAQAGAQMQNNFQQHGLFEQQFGAAGGLLNNGTMSAIQAQQFNNAARAQQQPFLPPNNDIVRQMGLLQQQNTPLHQQQNATMQLLSQRLGHPSQQPHPQQQQQQQQRPAQNRPNVLLALTDNIGQPSHQHMTSQLLTNMPSMRPEELISFARQGRQIESECSTLIGDLQNMTRGGANNIQTAQQIQVLRKRISFVQQFGLKVQQEIMVRKDKGQLPPQLLAQIPPPPGGPLPRTLQNGMTNPEWLKAHGAPPDLFTNGIYPQHEVQAAVERMRQSILNQGAGPQATQNQLAQLQALQAQHAVNRAPSRQQAPGPPNPATPGLPHVSPMPQPANPQQAPPQQPGGPQAPMTAADISARLRQLQPCQEDLFHRMWPAWVKQSGLPLTQDDIMPPETMQGKPNIPLWRLHVAVWQLGGHDVVGDRWAQLAGRLGWGTMNDGAGVYAPPMAAERLRQHHASHLKEFDKWYLHINRQKIVQDMQNQQGQGQQANQGMMWQIPEKVQQAVQAAVLGATADELKARGVGDDIIQFVEVHREALIQKHREQTAFKQGLQQQQQQQAAQQGQQQQGMGVQHPNGPSQMNGGGVGMGGQPPPHGMAPGQGGVASGGSNMGMPSHAPGQSQPPQVGHLSPAQLHTLAQRTLQLFGPLPAARDLKGVRQDGSIEQPMARVVQETLLRMKKSIEPHLMRNIRPVDPPVDVDRNEWMLLLERGAGLANKIEEKLLLFIAYTQGPNQQLSNILSKYVGQIMTVGFQRTLVSQHPPQYIVDLNALRSYIQQFDNLLVILGNRITAVRLELQQLHGVGPRPGSTQQPGHSGPPPGHMQQMGGQQQLGVPGQQQPHVSVSGQQPPTPQLGRVPTPQHRVPTPQQMAHRVPTPHQFPPTPTINSADIMPPPLPPNMGPKHQRKASDMVSPAAGGSPRTPAPANAASPQTPQTPKQKPKAKPKVTRRKSTVQAPAPAAAAEQIDDKKDAESSSAGASASTSTAKTGNKRPRDEDPAIAAASPKRAKADWEGAPSSALEERAKAAEEAPKDDAATSEFVDDMMRQFAQFEGDAGDAAPLVSGINAILASVLPGGDAGGLGKESADGLGFGGGADLTGKDDTFDFSQYLDFEAGLGSGSGCGTVGATPELVHGSSANPSPESGSEAEAAAAGSNTAPTSNASEKMLGSSLDLGLGAIDDPLHVGAWSEIDGGETSYDHGGMGWKWDAPMAASEQPWAIS